MKRTEIEQSKHDELNKIRQRRARLAEQVSKSKGRPVAWKGGRLYYLDGKMEKVRGIPDLPKPGREAVGWRRQLPAKATKTIARAQRAEMATLPEPVLTTPAPELTTTALKANIGELVDRRLAALRELAEKGISAK